MIISTLYMSIYSNMSTEQYMIILRKLAKQQKNQRALKLENKNLKQTHDINLAENLSPVTKKLDEVKEFSQKPRKLNGKSQLANSIPQPAIAHTQPHLPIKNKEGVIYDVESGNTLNNMKKNIGFFKIEDRDKRDVFKKDFQLKKLVVKILKLMRIFMI